MAHTVYFSNDSGTNTWSFNTAGGQILLRYNVATPKGGEQSLVDTVDVLITGTSTMNARSKRQDLEKLLELAVRRQEYKTGSRVYVLFGTNGDSITWRSEIFDYYIENLPDTVQDSAGANAIAFRLHITRQPFWENNLEVQLPLTNKNGTNNTAGLTIHNHNDTGQDNFTTINSSDIGGVLPAPLKLKITNIGQAKDIKNLYICNTMLNSGSENFTLEGEDGSASGGSSSAGAQYSNGSTYSFNTSTSGVTWSEDLINTNVQAIAGRNIRLLMKGEFSSPLNFSWWLETGGIKITPVTGEVRATNQDFFVDLGVLPIPPSRLNLSSWAPVTLVIMARSESGTPNLKIDFVHLMTADDKRRTEIALAAVIQVDINDVFVIDGIEESLYLDSNTTIIGALTILSQRGSLWVYPGSQNRLYFLHDGTNTSIDWQLSIRAWYRQRVLSPV